MKSRAQLLQETLEKGGIMVLVIDAEKTITGANVGNDLVLNFLLIIICGLEDQLGGGL